MRRKAAAQEPNRQPQECFGGQRSWESEMRFFGHGQHKDSDGSKHSLQLPIAGPLSFGAESGVRVLKRGFSESGLAQPNHSFPI